MIPSHRVATHPGVILLKEFLEPLGLSKKAAADHVGTPVQRTNEIIKGKEVFLRTLLGCFPRHLAHHQSSGLVFRLHMFQCALFRKTELENGKWVETNEYL